MKGNGNGVRIERRRLADGTVKEYYYERKAKAHPQGRTVASVIAEWQHSVDWDALRPSTIRNYTTYIDPFFDAMKHVVVKAVQRRQLMAIRDDIARERGHGAAAGFCQAVVAFFAWAIDRGIVDYSPATKLRKNLRRGEWPAWTEEQAANAARVLPEPYRRVVVLACNTGQRCGDLCAMRWSDYDGECIRVRQQKQRDNGRDTLQIPVTPELRAELDVWRRSATTLTILAAPNGQPWRAVYLSQQLPLELVKVDLPGLNTHGLRKLAATRLAQAGCSPHEIAAITGHKTLRMVEHYTKSVDQRRLANVAVLRLDSGDKEQTRLKSQDKSTA